MTNIETIDVVPDDLITALAGELRRLTTDQGDNAGYRFVVVGEGKHRMAQVEPAPTAGRSHLHDFGPEEIIDFRTDTVEDAIMIDGERVEINLV